MTDETMIRRNDLWMSAWIGQEMMMMSGDGGFCLSLTETGGRIWDLLAEHSTVSSLCHTLELEYLAPPEQIRTAVYAFLDQMLAADAILVEHAAVC